MADQLETIPQEKDLERKMARIRERLAWRPDLPDAEQDEDLPESRKTTSPPS